jgi:cobalt-zinc-cadmium efflux system outer membrane protein
LLTALGCAADVEDRRPAVSAAVEERSGFAIGNGQGLPDGVFLEDGLDEDEAVALALWASPGFQAALAELGLARADVEQAGLLQNPVLSVLFPLGSKQLEFAAKLPVETLWLRPARIEAATLDYERAALLLVRDGLGLVRDVRAGWAELRGAHELAAVLHAAADNRERAAELDTARLRNGDASESEESAAQAVALLAGLQAARADKNIELVEERLRALVGLPAELEADLQPGPACADSELPEVESLVVEAQAWRPERRASELELEAAGVRCELAKKDILHLGAVIDANERDKGGLEVGPGLDIELPVFGRRSRPDSSRAEAELESAYWGVVRTSRTIESEVRTAYLTYQQARDALLGLRRRVLPALEAALRASRRAQELGAVTAAPALAAEATLFDAQRAEVEAQEELEVARAELERCIGRRLE